MLFIPVSARVYKSLRDDLPEFSRTCESLKSKTSVELLIDQIFEFFLPVKGLFLAMFTWGVVGVVGMVSWREVNPLAGNQLVLSESLKRSLNMRPSLIDL